MRLESVRLHQFRSYQDAQFSFDPHITAIVGANGTGKTNILEAIYALCMGKSFRDGDDELITYQHDWYRIDGQFEEVVRELRYQPSNKGKQLLIDSTSKGRFTYRHQLPVVLFEPDDLMMIHGSPSGRRNYIDDLLTRLSLPYRQTLGRYERVLVQRNNILKQSSYNTSAVRDMLFAWDVSLSQLGAQIIEARLGIIAEINLSLSDVYSSVSGRTQTLAMAYVSPEAQVTETQLNHALHARLDDDIKKGFTSIGPHRHDLEFSLNNQSAKHTASRGEVRSIILSLKMLETQLMQQAKNVTPLFLLDDVFSELDARRRLALLETSQPYQTILTTTDREVILEQPGIKLISTQDQ